MRERRLHRQDLAIFYGFSAIDWSVASLHLTPKNAAGEASLGELVKLMRSKFAHCFTR